jgi:hypothetical protein
MHCHRLLMDQLFSKIEKEKDAIHKKIITTKKLIYWLGTSTLPPVGA